MLLLDKQSSLFYPVVVISLQTLPSNEVPTSEPPNYFNGGTLCGELVHMRRYQSAVVAHLSLVSYVNKYQRPEITTLDACAPFFWVIYF